MNSKSLATSTSDEKPRGFPVHVLLRIDLLQFTLFISNNLLLVAWLPLSQTNDRHTDRRTLRPSYRRSVYNLIITPGGPGLCSTYFANPVHSLVNSQSLLSSPISISTRCNPACIWRRHNDSTTPIHTSSTFIEARNLRAYPPKEIPARCGGRNSITTNEAHLSRLPCFRGPHMVRQYSQAAVEQIPIKLDPPQSVGNLRRSHRMRKSSARAYHLCRRKSCT
jgi:hypothetical protein